MKSRKKSIFTLAILPLFGLFVINQILWLGGGGAGIVYSLVLGRSYTGNATEKTEDAEWAKGHAMDFFDASGVSFYRAKNFSVAIAQEVMAPAPDGIVFRFYLPTRDFNQALLGKKRYWGSPQQAIHEYEGRLSPVRGFPFRHFSWWPPRQTKNMKIWHEDSMGDMYSPTLPNRK
jgi:hypothetical protein